MQDVISAEIRYLSLLCSYTCKYEHLDKINDHKGDYSMCLHPLMQQVLALQLQNGVVCNFDWEIHLFIPILFTVNETCQSNVSPQWIGG